MTSEVEAHHGMKPISLTNPSESEQYAPPAQRVKSPLKLNLPPDTAKISQSFGGPAVSHPRSPKNFQWGFVF